MGNCHLSYFIPLINFSFRLPSVFSLFVIHGSCHTHPHKHTHTSRSLSPCSCHLIYDKGQIAICLKAFYDCADLVMVPHHLSARGVSVRVCVCLCVCVCVCVWNMDSCSNTIIGPLSCRRYLCIGHSSRNPALYAWFIILKERQKRWEGRKRSS